jgi:hypothetical protein
VVSASRFTHGHRFLSKNSQVLHKSTDYIPFWKASGFSGSGPKKNMIEKRWIEKPKRLAVIG